MSKSTTITWERLDDILNRLTDARSLIEAIHMAANSKNLTGSATDALQTVCTCADARIADAHELVEEALEACK